mgnify:CR=1 FL=1
MKKIIAMLILIILMPVCVCAYEAPQMEGESGFNETVQSVRDGSFKLDPVSIFNSIMGSMVKEIKNSAGDIAVLLGVAAVSGIVNVLAGAFGEKGSGETAFFAVPYFFCLLHAYERSGAALLQYRTDIRYKCD